jgi:glycosyltransferase involved in cell wall biosynthesis
VIIPAYNYGHFVMAAIGSVQRQDHPNIEIIVIDDGSTDSTPQLLNGLPGIRYIRQENQGLSAARNNGIRLANGKYLQFLDADDLLGPTSIRKRLEYLERNPDRSAVICRSAFFKEQVYSERFAKFHSEWRQPDVKQVDLALYYFNIAPPHAFLVRKSEIDKHGLYFDVKLRACEDYDFWFRLALASGVPGLIRTCWVYYRQHAHSMSRSYLNQYRHDAELCSRIFSTVVAGMPWLGDRPPADYLSAMFASSLLTARRLWKIDPPSFLDFISGHILPLQIRFNWALLDQPATPAAHLYLSLARLTLFRMSFRDSSLDADIRLKLKRIFIVQNNWLERAITLVKQPISFNIVARILILDFSYAALVLLARRTRGTRVE